MTLKPLEIYKLLPKKNCKECGDPTCLTFAMKLSGGKAKPEACPYLDEHAKTILGASTRPPVRKIRMGLVNGQSRSGKNWSSSGMRNPSSMNPGYSSLSMTR